MRSDTKYSIIMYVRPLQRQKEHGERACVCVYVAGSILIGMVYNGRPSSSRKQCFVVFAAETSLPKQPPAKVFSNALAPETQSDYNTVVPERRYIQQLRKGWAFLCVPETQPSEFLHFLTSLCWVSYKGHSNEGGRSYTSYEVYALSRRK